MIVWKPRAFHLVLLIGISCQLAQHLPMAKAFVKGSMFAPSQSRYQNLPGQIRGGLQDSSSDSNGADGTLDLASYFKAEYQDAATRLSPTSIVDMVSLSSTPSAFSSSTEVSNPKPLRQQLFTSPLISVLYERVLPPLWEAGLRIGGPDAEYRAAADFLVTSDLQKKPSPPRVLLDLSCGTGFVGQRFAWNAGRRDNDGSTSGSYDHIFALDYSTQMLGELVNSLQRQRQQSTPSLPISILRGDAGKLPFQNDSLDAIHWGAAMHCVPNAELAFQEIYRVLKPGGRLYATTFLRPFPDIVFRFFSVEELKGIATQTGFGDNGDDFLQVEGKGVYGIVKAIK